MLLTFVGMIHDVTATEVLHEQKRRFFDSGSFTFGALNHHHRCVEVLLLLAKGYLPQEAFH